MSSRPHVPSTPCSLNRHSPHPFPPPTIGLRGRLDIVQEKKEQEERERRERIDAAEPAEGESKGEVGSSAVALTT